MLNPYLVFAFRSLERNRAFTFINVLGLSVGLTAFILIMLYVRYELSFDDFHEDKDNVYRVVTEVTLQNEVINRESSTYEGIIRALKEGVPAVKDVTVLSAFDSDDSFIRFVNEQQEVVPLHNYKGLYADNSFFNVLSFPLVAGQTDAVLKKPHSAVISQAWASEYFNNNAIGKILEFKNDNQSPHALIVTGVMENVPHNSHLKFDIVIHVPEQETGFWDWGGHAYLKLRDDSDPVQIENTLDALAAENNGLKINKDDYGQASTFKLQSLEDIHLHSNLEYEFEPAGNALFVSSLMNLALIILILAWINYVNLYTAISIQKIRQIGIRKAIGASRKILSFQVLVESALCNFLATVIAVGGSWILFPSFSNLVGVQGELVNIRDTDFGIWAVAFFAFSTLASGTYPAIVISSYSCLRAIKGKVTTSNNQSTRRTLMMFQFAVATVLIITTISVYTQLRFMQNQQLGIEIDKVVVVKALNFDKEFWSDSAGGYIVDPIYQQKSVLFMNQLREHQAILNAASLSHLPGQLPSWGTEFKASDIDPSKAFTLKAVGVDYNFIPTLGVSLLAGRNFSPDYPADHGNETNRAVIVNEAASQILGFASPQQAVSKHINTYWGAKYEIVGVVNSFHQLSLKEELTPLYFILQPRALSYFVVSFRSDNIKQIISELESAWIRHFPDYPFDYFFLDEYFNNQYQREAKFVRTTGIFTVLALFIALMGLLGLSSHAIVRRSKEIAIRKMLGASISNVIALLSSQFMKLVFLANIIAIPAAYYGLNAWLDTYAYKISLTWLFFAGPVLFVLIIVVITVALQSLKVALSNPVEKLKQE